MRVRVSFAVRQDTVDESHAPRSGCDPRKRGPRGSVSRYFFLSLAIVSLGLYGYTYLERVLYQAYESWSFDRAPERSASAARSDHEIAPMGLLVDSPQKAVPPAESASSTSMIGRLSVPRLHLSAMVREGIDRNTLQLAVGHIPATALPGQAGNVGVAGHRDTFFRGLKDLRTKDEIQFSTPGGDFKYEVEALMVVEPDNVAVLAPSGENVLTMVTCYPFSYIGAAPKRFIVRARQVSPQTQSPSTVEGFGKPFGGTEPHGAEGVSSLVPSEVR